MAYKSKRLALKLRCWLMIWTAGINLEVNEQEKFRFTLFINLSQLLATTVTWQSVIGKEKMRGLCISDS